MLILLSAAVLAGCLTTSEYKLRAKIMRDTRVQAEEIFYEKIGKVALMALGPVIAALWGGSHLIGRKIKKNGNNGKGEKDA